jgi:hypothetical protein
MEYFIMEKKDKCDLANFALLHAYTAASMYDGSDDMIDFEMLDQVKQNSLMELQKLLCRSLDIKPEDFSLIGSEVLKTNGEH